jgi:adenylate kinase
MLESVFNRSKYITSGGLVREELRNDPILWDRVARGELVDSDVIIRLMKKEYDFQSQQGINMIVVDGFPRKLDELKNWIEYTGSPNLTVSLESDYDMLVQILTNRLACEACGRSYNSYSDKFLRPLLPKVSGRCDQCSGVLIQRDDDKEEAIRRRLHIYESNESEISKFLKSNDHQVVSWQVSHCVEEYRQLVDKITPLV